MVDIIPPLPSSIEDVSMPKTRSQLLLMVSRALEQENPESIRSFIPTLHYCDGVWLLENLNYAQRIQLVKILHLSINAKILRNLNIIIQHEVLRTLGFETLAEALNSLTIDKAKQISTQEVPTGQQQTTPCFTTEHQTDERNSRRFLASHLMQCDLVTAPSYWSVSQTLDYLCGNVDLPEIFYDLYIVDACHRPIGTIAICCLTTSDRSARLRDIMDPVNQTVTSITDQLEVAILFREYEIDYSLVVDCTGCLVGIITIDDIINTTRQANVAGACQLMDASQLSLYRTVITTIWFRSRWLAINLVTATLSSAVIGFFNSAIEKTVILAVLMPIVASVGGNAGTQTLTVAVRALAMRELAIKNLVQVLGKELLVGSLNGVIFAIVIGIITWIRFGQSQISFVIAIAAVVNLLCAALAGMLVPICFNRLKIDPAVASPMFVTGVTDAVGFFVFLSLATWFLS